MSLLGCIIGILSINGLVAVFLYSDKLEGVHALGGHYDGPDDDPCDDWSGLPG